MESDSGSLRRRIPHHRSRKLMNAYPNFRCLALGFALAALSLRAQDGSLHVFRTGAGNLPSGESVSLAPFPAGSDARLEFDFGFATGETASPGELHDSFTASLEGGSGAFAYLVTADAFGTLWAPANPDGSRFPDGNIGLLTILPPIDVTPATLVGSFHVTVAIPEGFSAQALTLRFDLFDNTDASSSVGFFRGVQTVPEPSTVVTTMIGAVLLAVALRGRGRAREDRPRIP